MPDNQQFKKPHAMVIQEVDEDSPAFYAGIMQGDLLLEINHKPILDILDYRFYSADEKLQLRIQRDDQILNISIKNEDGEDPGLSFEDDLGDKIHTCVNKCMFCFIHQMPHKMRHSLYLMDDDYRLSFMHGNYITLTNLSEQEFQRIIDQRLSPLYVSVHATDPELRGRLLGKKEPAPIIPHLRRLAENRISVHAQIVLCPGVNDGEALEKTLEELASLNPVNSGYRSGVESVAIVPVGLTQFRERLPHLVSADRDYARRMIAENRQAQRLFVKSIGTRFAWLSDEWRFLADMPFPGIKHYEQFPQLEDGVGTVRLFLENAKKVNRQLPEKAKKKVSATLVTAELASGIIRTFAARLNQIDGVCINVCVIKNRFFGGGINIAGLMTSTDILAQLKNFPANDVVYIPEICLRDRETFLDDRTLEDLRQESGLDIRISGIRPRDLTMELGLLPFKGVRSEGRMI